MKRDDKPSKYTQVITHGYVVRDDLLKMDDVVLTGNTGKLYLNPSWGADIPRHFDGIDIDDIILAVQTTNGEDTTSHFIAVNHDAFLKLADVWHGLRYK